MLSCENISKTYLNRATGAYEQVLTNCSLEIGNEESVGLMGSSGCGKSTLARILLRLIPADQGRIFFESQDITRSGNKELQKLYRKVQLVSQRPESFFDPIFRLGKSLREPLKLHGRESSETEIEELLELVKLNRAILDRYPHQVSGGEIQRLSLARALILKPKLLVLDEPTSMLDVSVQAQILHLLKSIRQERQISYLLITHDVKVADFMCDRVLRMEKGRII